MAQGITNWSHLKRIRLIPQFPPETIFRGLGLSYKVFRSKKLWNVARISLSREMT